MALESLTRIQGFDPTSLERKTDLGSAFEMSGAVQPARKLVDLFKLLPKSSLDYFPDSALKQIGSTSASNFRLFSEVLEFNPSSAAEPAAKRKELIDKLESSYQPTFSKLLPLISFSVARTADFQSLAEEGRATVQGVEDRIAVLVEEIASQGEDVGRVLEEARTNLAEKGVSQEAYHFQKQADTDKSEAEVWRLSTLYWALALGGFAACSVFIHKLAFLAPQNAYDAAQLIVGKVLCFGVIAYMLALSAKNYLSHRHNEVVNRHRQNALMTYKSLVEAGGTQEARDIILQQAASAIYQLQDTGYVKSSEKMNSTITELIPRASIPISNIGS